MKTPPAPDLGLLPAPPWRLQRAFVRRQRLWSWLIPLGGGALAVLLTLQIGEALAIVRDGAIHAGTTVQVEAEWDGAQMPGWRFLPASTVGRVSYVQVDGTWQRRDLTLSTATKFNVRSPLRVYYDPNDPSRWVTNWAVEQTANRWTACIQVLLLFGAGLLWLLWLGVRAFTLLRLARSVASHGTEAFGTLVGTKAHHRKGRLTAKSYRVRLDGADGVGRHTTASFPAGAGRPLFLPNDRVLVLCAAENPGRALVLRQDLWPLWLTDEQVSRACAILQRLDPTAGWRTTMTTRGMRMTCWLAPSARERS